MSDQPRPDPKAIYERNKAYAKPGPYETALNPIQEQRFRDWVKTNDIPFDPDTKQPQDYDMRGFYLAMQNGRVKRDPETMHFTDEFKTPYHESFSNESRYATHDAPRWVENNLVDKTGRVVFTEPQRGSNNAQQNEIASPAYGRSSP